MCYKVVSEESFVLKCCLNRYKAQEMCDKAGHTSLPALKFGIIWLVMSEMIEKLDPIFSKDDIFIHNIASNIIIFSWRHLMI